MGREGVAGAIPRTAAEEQRQAPALLNGLSKLQIGAGDYTEARQTFTEVVAVVGNATDKAEGKKSRVSALKIGRYPEKPFTLGGHFHGFCSENRPLS